MLTKKPKRRETTGRPCVLSKERIAKDISFNPVHLTVKFCVSIGFALLIGG